MRTQVLSYGGGRQSVAMLVLAVEGKLPRPDFVVIADTGREASSTWDYLDEVVQPYLARHGMRVDIAPHTLATVDLYSHQGALLIPAYTTQNGHGKLPTYCSTEWKQRVVRRWLREQGVTQCESWIGYTIDEIERVKPSDVQWDRRVFPLIDLMLTRADCEHILERAGLPVPPKSACWMCPHRNNSEWRFLRDEYPEDFERAVDLELEVRDRDEHVWLHKDAVPLDQVDLDQPDVDEPAQCGLGMCFV